MDTQTPMKSICKNPGWPRCEKKSVQISDEIETKLFRKYKVGHVYPHEDLVEIFAELDNYKFNEMETHRKSRCNMYVSNKHSEKIKQWKNKRAIQLYYRREKKDKHPEKRLKEKYAVKKKDQHNSSLHKESEQTNSLIKERKILNQSY